MHTASARFLCRIDLSEDKWRMACWTHMPRLELANLTRAAGVRLGGSKHVVVGCVRVAGSDVLRVAGVEETAVHVQPENTLCRFSIKNMHTSNVSPIGRSQIKPVCAHNKLSCEVSSRLTNTKFLLVRARHRVNHQCIHNTPCRLPQHRR